MKLLSALLLILGSLVALSKSECPKNQEFNPCGGCDQVCNKGPISCAAVCGKPGCACKQGYYRRYDTPGSDCVSLSECPGQPKCNINEQYSGCNGCDQICNAEPIACAADCSRPGCYCRPGFVRAFKGPGSICIPRGDCPTVPDQSSPLIPNPGQRQCPPFEEYNNCGGCDQICNEETVFCAAGCVRPGCYCAPGFVRAYKGPGSNCIPVDKCQQCEINEVYNGCGGCDQVCNKEPIFCTLSCNRPGCYCRPGYIRAFDELGSGCIPQESCLPFPNPDQQKCQLNEEYNDCGGCDQICNEKPILCTLGCTSPGCYCRPGFVRAFKGPNSICIPRDSCPSIEYPELPMIPPIEYPEPPMLQNTGYQCDDTEEFNDCGVGWQCENYCGRGANACAYCEPGCYCKAGYIRSGPEFDAICIPEDQCPRAQDTSSDVDQTIDYQCGDTEEFIECGVGWQCEDYCGRGANACAYCEPGCYCKSGYIRDGPDYDAVCIPDDQCPRAQEISSVVVQDTGFQCGENEVYNDCGVGVECEDFCGRGPIACASYCQPGCYCKPGYVRDGPDYDAVCIPEDQCPRAQDPGFQCGENEVYNDCGVGVECEDFCGRGPIACASYCQPGCYCKPGYIRDGPDYDAVCVPEDQCPRAQVVPPRPQIASAQDESSFSSQDSDASSFIAIADAGAFISQGEDANSFIPQEGPGAQDGSSFSSQGEGYQCRPNEVFNQCGVGQECEDYCGKGPIACSYCQPGCYCKQGFVRAGPSNRTICVPENKCPVKQKCLQNEVYNKCGTACPESCDSRNRICTKNCVTSCFCKKGFIRIHDDTQTTRYKCIPEGQCPVPQVMNAPILASIL